MLNRFSSDQGQLDETLPPIFFDAIQCASMVLGTVVMVCVAIPWICIAMLPVRLFPTKPCRTRVGDKEWRNGRRA